MYQQAPTGLGIEIPGFGDAEEFALDLLMEVGLDPDGIVYPRVTEAYRDAVNPDLVRWMRTQGERFGASIVDGSGKEWTPSQPAGGGRNVEAQLYRDFARPLIDPFTAGVQAKLVPFAVEKATNKLAPLLLVGGLAVGFFVGRAAK